MEEFPGANKTAIYWFTECLSWVRFSWCEESDGILGSLVPDEVTLVKYKTVLLPFQERVLPSFIPLPFEGEQETGSTKQYLFSEWLTKAKR